MPGCARLGGGAAVRCVLGFSVSLNSTESGPGSLMGLDCVHSRLVLATCLVVSRQLRGRDS